MNFTYIKKADGIVLVYDPSEEDDMPMMEDLNIGGKKNLEAIAAYNNVLGAKIEMDIEEAPDGEYFED